MKFKTLRANLQEKMLKPTSPKMRLQMAIAIALDMGGNMTGAYKKIEKIEKGLGDHPAVKAALRFANESVNEKLSAADKKKRLIMIRKAVEKMKDRELKMAKKDALAAIKALESVEESIDEGVNGMTGKKVGLTYRPQRQNSNKFGKGLSSHSTIHTSDLLQDIKNNAFELRDDCNSIAIRVPEGRARDKNRTDWLNLINSVKPGGNITNLIRSGPLTKAEAKELFGDMKKAAKAFGGKVNAQSHEISISNYGGKLNIDKGLNAMLKAIDEFGMRNHVSVSGKEGVLTRIQDAGRYGTNESVTEGKLDKQERTLNLKLKELEYKMKLSDFKNKIKEYGHTVVKNKKKLPEADTSELKVSDTSSTTFNKLSKLAKDIGVEISREENHLKIMGDAKKMEEFKAQMSVAMKESVQLQEGMSKQMPIEKYAKKIGINKKEQQWILDNEADMIVYEPNQNKANSFLVLSYPVNDGDYYFAFLTSTKGGVEVKKAIELASKSNAKMNKTLKQLVAKNKKHIGDPNLSGFVYNEMNKQFDKLPRALGAGDTMTREELASAVEDICKAQIMWEGKLTPNKPQIAEGIFASIMNKIRNAGKKFRSKMGRRGKTTMESKKTFKEARMSIAMKESIIKEGMNMYQIMRKHGSELRKAARTGNLELSKKAEEALQQWVFDNEPYIGDDPDEFDAWLDDNLDDIIKGRLK